MLIVELMRIRIKQHCAEIQANIRYGFYDIPTGDFDADSLGSFHFQKDAEMVRLSTSGKTRNVL
jgi:hypothetical protein